MNELYRGLSKRIRGEVAELDRVVDRVFQSWSQVGSASVDQAIVLDSVALNLHGLYSGLERLFEQIARQVDGHLPKSPTWHRELLNQMATDIADARPAVVSQQNVSILDEFRRFRHLVRNVYAIDLLPEKMTGLIEALPQLWPRLRAELLAFAEYLEALSSATPDDRGA